MWYAPLVDNESKESLSVFGGLEDGEPVIVLRVSQGEEVTTVVRSNREAIRLASLILKGTAYSEELADAEVLEGLEPLVPLTPGKTN